MRGILLQAIAVFCLGLSSLAPGLADARRQPFDLTRWNNDAPPSTRGVFHATFHSRAMDLDVGFNIYLPPAYFADPRRRFPVIYFLHGRGGDENSDVAALEGLIASGTAVPCIVVFPNGGRDSKYMDAAPGSPMHGVIMSESAIIDELIPTVDARYRTRANRSGRAIQGFSMGGMGALRLAFKYPALFGSVYAFAPAVVTYASNIGENDPEVLAQMFKGDAVLWEANVARTQARRNAPRIRAHHLPVGLSVGAQDGLLPFVRDFAQDLARLQIPYSFEIVPKRGHVLDFGEGVIFAARYFSRR